MQVFTGGRSQVFMLTQQIFSGEPLPHPQMVEWRLPTLSLTPPRPLPVVADGLLPASRCELPDRERALRLKI